MKYDFDNFISDSKNVIDKLAVKANQAADVSKAYVEKAQIRVKLRDKYYELGKVCYSMHRDDTDETGTMKKIIKEIKLLEEQLEYAEELGRKPKYCRLCGAKNAADNAYCCKCGEKL